MKDSYVSSRLGQSSTTLERMLMKRMAKRDAGVAKSALGEGLNEGEGVPERAGRGARIRGVAQVKLAEPLG